jgi:hypothetical protein
VPIDEVANASGTVGYELLCALAPRVPVVETLLDGQSRRLSTCAPNAGARVRSGKGSVRIAMRGIRWPRRASRRQATEHRYASLVPTAQVQSLSDVQAREMPRIGSGIDEFDRVLGGGLVEGGVVLIGGDPGIGKSTLLLQSLATLAASTAVLYVSGEESAAQIALRARRLGIDAGARCSAAAARRNFARADRRDDPVGKAGGGRHRFDPDRILAGTAVRARVRWRKCANVRRS